MIECQKDELQFTRDQIRQLTDGGSEDSGPGGGLSLPTNVSESGPLKRQLIKLQHSIKVSVFVFEGVCVYVCVYVSVCVCVSVFVYVCVCVCVYERV